MNAVTINKLEWDILDRIDKGDSDEQIVEYVRTHYLSNTEDLISVIRQMYLEINDIIEQNGIT